MWPMIAGTDLRCRECGHSIQPGRLCLSELPEETPAGVNRQDFKNYCIGCPQCWSQGKHACYVRRLESGLDTGRTPRSLPCARCGRRIAGGEKAGVEIYYEWANVLEEANTSKPTSPFSKEATAGIASASLGVDVLIRGVPSGSFSDLSSGLIKKFKDAGLSGGRGVRNLHEAQEFYRESTPYPVRNLGEGAVKEYLAGKEASHIDSVKNAPQSARDSDNLVWEDSGINRTRGSKDMTGMEKLDAKATNAFDASTIVFRECLESGAMTALYTALLESPVAVIENYYHYKRGRKTGEDAVKDAAMAIGKRAAAGFAVGFTITAAVVLVPGTAAVLVTMAPVLVPVGIALYSYSALKRILDARAYDLPPGLSKVGTYFCSPRCHTIFAYEAGKSAFMRWEANRVTNG